MVIYVKTNCVVACTNQVPLLFTLLFLVAVYMGLPNYRNPRNPYKFAKSTAYKSRNPPVLAPALLLRYEIHRNQVRKNV